MGPINSILFFSAAHYVVLSFITFQFHFRRFNIFRSQRFGNAVQPVRLFARFNKPCDTPRRLVQLQHSRGRWASPITKIRFWWNFGALLISEMAFHDD